MGDLLMKPKIDFAFKELMAEERVRTGFLSAVLGIDPDSVRKTRLLNTYLRKEHQDDRQGILDVRVSLEDGTEIDIEIQLTALRVWGKRATGWNCGRGSSEPRGRRNSICWQKRIHI